MSHRRPSVPRRRAALLAALVTTAALGGCGSSTNGRAPSQTRSAPDGVQTVTQTVKVTPMPAEHLGGPGRSGVYDASPGRKK